MRLRLANLKLVLVAATLILPAFVSSKGQQQPRAPRTADNKVDLSGVWIVNGAVNLPADPSYLPAAKKKWDEALGKIFGGNAVRLFRIIQSLPEFLQVVPGPAKDWAPGFCASS